MAAVSHSSRSGNYIVALHEPVPDIWPQKCYSQSLWQEMIDNDSECKDISCTDIVNHQHLYIICQISFSKDLRLSLQSWSRQPHEVPYLYGTIYLVCNSIYFKVRRLPLRKVPSMLPPRLSYARNKSVEAYIYPRLWWVTISIIHAGSWSPWCMS